MRGNQCTLHVSADRWSKTDTCFMGCVLNIQGRVLNSSYSQTHTFTVTVLWKAAAAMSSHPTICQRGCFSILGMGSEIHRAIHTSQIDMLASGSDHYKHQLWDGTGIWPAYCKFAQRLDFCEDWVFCFQPQHLVFSFPFWWSWGCYEACSSL